VKKVLIFVLVMGASFGGMFLVMQQLKKDGGDKALAEVEQKEGVEESTKSEAPKEEESKYKEETPEAKEEAKVEETKTEVAKAEAEKELVKEVAEAPSEEPAKKVALPESYLGYNTDDAMSAVFASYDSKLGEIDKAVSEWADANLPAEDRLAIAGIDKGYLYSVDHDRTFLPGIVLRLKNSTDQTITDPVHIKVRYKRIATNEIWSVEETTIKFGKNKILEKDEVIQRKFFSEKGVESMRHIMPDLEAKIFINGKLFTTFKVGEKEYLDWF
jgi:hypothetical protein